MSRAYLRLDPAFDERKADYPDGPYAALIACFCLAEMQPTRGRFRSVRFLKALLDGRARHVQYLIDHGDLIVQDDDKVYVDGWDEWQEGDWKVGERVARVRNRKRRVTPDVTPGVTVGVTVPTVQGGRLDLSDSGGGGGDKAVAVTGPSAFDTYMECTGWPVSDKALPFLREIVEGWGHERTATTMRRLWDADPDKKTIFGRVKTALLNEDEESRRVSKERKKRGAIDEMRELEAKLAEASPEEQARAAQLRESIGAFVKGAA